MKNTISKNPLFLRNEIRNHQDEYESNKGLNHTYSESMNLLILKGNSDMQSKASYNLIMNKVIDHFSNMEKDSLLVYVGLTNFDSTSYQHSINMVELLNNFYKRGSDIKILWSLKHRTEMLDVGLTMLPYCDFPFTIVDV